MTDNEKRDFLIEVLTMLYRIREAEHQKEPQTEKEIKHIEVRLSAMGFNDFNNLK